MHYYDLNIRGKNYNSDKELILEAYRLGWNYLKILYSPGSFEYAIDYKKKLIQELSNITKTGIDKNHGQKLEIDFGIEINPKNQDELYKLSKKYRDKTRFISVLGGNLDVNRGGCENRQVDVLSRPYFNQRSCGINHVLAKEAIENDVAIEICFKDILSTYLSFRSKIMAYFREIIKLYQKFKFHLIISTGSSSIWDTKSPRDIFAVFKYLGLSEDEFNTCIQDYPKNIIDFNNELENIIVLGVKRIDKDKL